MNRWAELRAGTLTPPAVVQRDTAPDGAVMLWVWDGKSIIGPVFRKLDADDSAVAIEVRNTVKDRPALRDVIDDLRDTVADLRTRIDEKNAKIDKLQATIAAKNAVIDQKNSRIATLQARIAELEKK